MPYLLDTHTYLWLRHSPNRLPERVLKLLSDTSQQCLISLVTPCEIAIKTGAGKLNGAPLLNDFEKRETAVGFSIAGITIPQAIAAGLLPRHHRDPFDRLLIAQCIHLNIPILGNDSVFDAYGIQRIWD
jgi:PIN domain nuclease of toxin-antitoxin system